MPRKLISSVVLCLSIAAVLAAQSASTDGITGLWFGDYGPNLRDRTQIRITFKWDGENLTGSVTAGDDPLNLENGNFDPKTGSVHLEVTVPTRSGSELHYVVDGKLDNEVIKGMWHNEISQGDFSVKKIR